MGNEGEGWKIAMNTLTFERGVTGGQAGGTASVAMGVSDVIELARRAKRDGRPAIEDPLIRDQLMQFVVSEQGDRLCSSRGRVQPLVSERPGAIPMSGKLRGTELRRELFRFAISLQGSAGARWIGDNIDGDDGRWTRSYFNSFSATIGGGTSQVQANIVGERVLGLPKD